MTTVPVVIVGAGPTGLTAATLLARYGIETTIIDQWESIYPLPRAVALDDEVYRILARLGVGDDFAAIAWPCRGLRLVDRNLRLLAEFARDGDTGRHGYPEQSMFDQPELEAILRRNLARCPGVTLRGGTEATAVAQGDDHVRVDVVDPRTGEAGSLRAAYVLGCDGANSLVRSCVGATMRDLGFTQRWLVVDVRCDADLGQWEGVHQCCDPARAGTFMRIGRARYRWEFRLRDGETAADFGDLDRLRPLVAPWLRQVPAARLEIVRSAEYTFRAQIADRWRDRRVFLLGDSAHLMPPFIGQGLGAGLRDAMNLTWKLAAVLSGRLPAAVLDSYQVERAPHARAMIHLAKLVGFAMTAGGEWGDLFRRVVAPRLRQVPGLRQRVTDSQSPALSRSDLVLRPRLRRTLAGTLCPNAVLPGDARLDDVAAGRFALVTSARPSAAHRAELARRDIVLVPVRSGNELHRWLRRGRADAALVRPDGTVLRAGRLGVLCTTLPVPAHPTPGGR